MKICPNCNKQYEDNCTFCATCGIQLNSVAQAPATPEVPKTPKEKSGSVIMTFISNVLSVISLFFGLVAIAVPYIRVSVNVGKSYNIYAYGYHYPEEGCAVFALIFALGAFVVGLIAAIQCFTQKLGMEKNFSKITKLVANTFLLIFAIILVSEM